MATVWIALSSKSSILTMSVISLNRTHVLMSLNVISPSSGRDVINVIQWSQGQDVRHVTMVIRVMEMEVAWNVKGTLLPSQIVTFLRNVINVGCVQKGITLMMMMVHV